VPYSVKKLLLIISPRTISLLCASIFRECLVCTGEGDRGEDLTDISDVLREEGGLGETSGFGGATLG